MPTRSRSGGLHKGNLFDTNVPATSIDKDIFTDQEVEETVSDDDLLLLLDVSESPDKVKYMTRSDFTVGLLSDSITITDNESTDENDLIPFVANAADSTGSQALEMDGDFHYNPSTGRITATQVAGTLQTASQTNITGVGTITTGTWQATDVGVAHGGTGASSLTANAILTGNGTSAIQAETDLLFDSNKLIPTAAAHDTAGTALSISAGATTAGTTNNIAGGALTIQGGRGKGSGAGGAIIFQTANAGGSGSSLNSLSTALTINDDGSLTTSGTIELGHASDTTIARSGSGDITIEGNAVYRAGGTDVAVADGGTGASTLNNLITMGTHTTGNYVATVTAGTGLTSSGATSGESVAHSLSVDASQTQITSVGTIGTGTWEATDVAVAHGGTGASTATAGFDALSPMTSEGDIIYGGSSGTVTRLGKGSDTQVLTLASGVPTWATPTTGDITGVTAGNGLSGGGSSGGVSLALDLSELTDTAIANGDYIVFTDTTDSNASVKGDLADVATLFAGTGLTASSSVIGVDASQTQITSVGTIGTGTWEATDVAVAHGGTGASTLTANGVLIGNGTSAVTAVDMSTKGGILAGDGSGNPSVLAVGASDGHVLTVDSSEATGLKYAAVAAGAATSLAATSASANQPLLTVTNTHADATAGILKFIKDPGSGQGADNDVIGTLTFYGTDASNNAPEELARMEAYVIEADHGSEAGGIKFSVAENDATMTAGLQILGVKDADGEIDVTIGAGAASTTIIAGTLTMGSTASMTNAGLLSVANQSNITGLGTISSGTWEATDVAVAHGGTGASSAGDARTNLGLGTAAVAATGISNTNVPVFTTGAADNDFLRIDGTSIEGRSASEVLSDISAAPAAGDSNIVTTGALDAGSITSGFGAIDNGTSGIRTNTFTAETSIVPDAVGGADLGSTSAEWGEIFIADDKAIKFGNGQDASIEYDEDGTDQLRITGNTVFANQLESTLDVMIDSTPADETVSGVTATFTAGEDLVRGEVVYFKASDSKMWKAVATAAATSRCVAMAAADISADAAGLFLLQGFLADNGSFPSYTIGGALYTPEAETSSQNVPEQTAPDSDGDFVQVLGWAMTANSVYFNPSNDIIEHA
jgi:hypothetical protein